jgi:hypothetical protein
VTFEKHLESKILKALLAIMFMRVAYEIYELQNTSVRIRNGGLETPMEEHDFF